LKKYWIPGSGNLQKEGNWYSLLEGGCNANKVQESYDCGRITLYLFRYAKGDNPVVRLKIARKGEK
jgi:hypothetical protein